MTPTKTIEFSHEFTKLMYQQAAVLIAMYKTQKSKLSPTFLSYDTEYFEKGIRKYYHIEQEELIFLIFLGEFNIPFTTIRSYTPKKFDYYKSALREKFILARRRSSTDETENNDGNMYPAGWLKKDDR